MASLEYQPAKNGTAQFESVAAMNVAAVRGIFFSRPPILSMSCSWWQPWMTEPAPRKSVALKNACIAMCSTASSGWPRPRAQPMIPR